MKILGSPKVNHSIVIVHPVSPVGKIRNDFHFIYHIDPLIPTFPRVEIPSFEVKISRFCLLLATYPYPLLVGTSIGSPSWSSRRINFPMDAHQLIGNKTPDQPVETHGGFVGL